MRRIFTRILSVCALFLVIFTSGILMAGPEDRGDVSILPVGSAPKALDAPHFPNRLCAFVWRNWNLLELDALARTLETTPANVEVLAAKLGLPPYQKPQWQSDQIYITILRRNWHLLPYEQILTLLDISAETLDFRLREDDFLYIKLGSLKPQCEPLVYAPLTDEEEAKLAAWRETLTETLGGAMTQENEAPRFQFINELKQVSPEAATVKATDSAKGQFDVNFVYSYFALFGDPLLDDNAELYPDGLLEKLQKAGVTGVWLHVVLRDMAPGGIFPEFGAGHEKRVRNLRRLVERAGRYGIGVYLYMNEPRAAKAEFFEKSPERMEMRGARGADGYYSLCTSNPAVRKWLGDSLAYLFREVPNLGGVFTITASENQTNCVSHGQQGTCPRCAQRSDAEILAEVNATIEEGVHRSAPNAKVLVWDWGWRGHGMATDIIEKLPKNVYLMSVSEWALPICRGGVESAINEYSISAVGPGPRALAHWKAAQAAGLKTAAKVQLGTTWEIGSVPYVPALGLVAQHCRNLAETNVNALMSSWSLGGYPSPNLSLPKYFQREEGKPLPTVEEVLTRLATDRFGAEFAPEVVAAWNRLSEGFAEYPYHVGVNYNGPQHMGPANPLYWNATGYAASMVGIPYDDLNAWRCVYPEEVFVSQLRKVAGKFAEGVAMLKKTAERMPPEAKAACMQDCRYAEVVGLHYASAANQAEFVQLRNRLQALSANPEGGNSAEKAQITARLQDLITDEIQLAKREYALCQEDSAIGFESTNHYWFVPQDLVEKLMNCRYVAERVKEAVPER